jgi:HEAT repeat protein
MIRILPLLLVLVVPSGSSAAPPDLRGKTLAATFAELLPGMSAKDNGARSAAQGRWQEICTQAGAPGNEKFREEACLLMAGKLGAKTPTAARVWLLLQLQRIGRDECLAAVSPLLLEKDDEVRDAAIRCLSNNPSPKATALLTGALKSASEKASIGLLNALGHRGDATAVSAVAAETNSMDEAVAIAAARALGRIPGPEAAKALQEARAGSKGAVAHAIADATLNHADRLLKAGKTAEAASIYKELHKSTEPKPVRLAALRGLIQSAGDAAGEMVLGILSEKDAAERAVALGQIAGLNAASLGTVAGSLEKMPVASRVQVINAISARGDRSLLPLALTAAKSKEADLQQAGLQAIGRLGDASVVEFLLGVMVKPGASGPIAAQSLVQLPAEGVDEKLIVLLEGGKFAQPATLIGILEQRKSVAAVPALLVLAGGSDPALRAAAFSGLRALASPEQVPGMVKALLKTEKGKDRNQAEQAIVQVCAQISDPDKRADAVIAALRGPASGHEADLLPLVGSLGGTQALRLIREALKSDNSMIRTAALEGIRRWPNAAASDDLLALAESAMGDSERLQALRALIRVNTTQGERTQDERLAALAMMKKAMTLAKRDEEQRSILSGVGYVRHIDTLRFVVPYLDDPALAQAACKGVVELAHSKMLREPNRAEFAKALDRVIAICKDKGLVERARQYKEGR